ncbi:pyridoxamine 5'-phosphate oxidase family protein [Lysinibacillus sphaericus]|uniref:pyridoxamine 5'-phosphate oxidase family protein n=1 Tax=Lysinibacillus sphaericus TaxID=1421 RepID=UPI0037FA9E70
METNIRKADRTFTNEGQINNFLREAQTAFLGLVDHNMPYVIPLNFVFKEGIFYIHGANEGRKITILHTNSNACMTISGNYGTIADPIPANTDTAYMSVIANGIIEVVTNLDEATAAMQAMLDKYVPAYYQAPLSKAHVEKYQSSLGSKTIVLKLKPITMTAKAHQDNGQMKFYPGRSIQQDI